MNDTGSWEPLVDWCFYYNQVSYTGSQPLVFFMLGPLYSISWRPHTSLIWPFLCKAIKLWHECFHINGTVKFSLTYNTSFYMFVYYMYSFIQYYKTIYFVFCDKSSYCRASFHIERYLIYLSGVWNCNKIYKTFVFYIRYSDITQTQTKSDTEVLQMQ